MAGQKYPIVAFAPHPWEEPQWMNRQQLLSRLADRGWPIYYCTGAMHVWHRRSANWKTAPLLHNRKHVDNVTLIVAGKAIPIWPKLWHGESLPIRNYCKFIRKLANLRHSSRFICLSFHPEFLPYVEALNPTYCHSHIYDAYWRTGSWGKKDCSLLKKQLRYSNLITASSPAMIENLKSFTSKEPQYLPNGADVKSFNSTRSEEPADLAPIPHPRIANIGAFNRKIDIRCLYELAKSNSNWNFVFVGDVKHGVLSSDKEFAEDFENIQKQKNVYFLGEKDRTQIPAYANNMDILTMCYRISKNNWANEGYPLKLHEYLATGLPVISSPIDIIKTEYRNIVTIAQGTIQWQSAICELLSSDDPVASDKRKKIAEKNSWDERVDKLESLYSKMLTG